MTLDDRQVESMLRKLPLTKPSTSLDARVMARPTIKIWSYIGAGSAMAAAAAVLIVVTLNWSMLTGGGDTGTVVRTTGENAPEVVVNGGLAMAPSTGDLQPIAIVPVVNIIEDKIIPGGDNLPPLRQITRETFEKTTWVDKTNGIHIETTSSPHREIIINQVEVK